MDNPPGYMANRMTVRANQNGRCQVPVRSRGAGTYILCVDRPIQMPMITGYNANGTRASRSYDFKPTGRPRANWLVWHLDSNARGAFDVWFTGGSPGTSVACALWLAPPGTPMPAGQQWRASDWRNH